MILEFGYTANHSEDMKIIAVFGTDKKAHLAYARLMAAILRYFELNENLEKYDDNDPDPFSESTDWGLDDATIGIDSNRVFFRTYTAGYLHDVFRILEDAGGQIEVEDEPAYQSIAEAYRDLKGELGLLKKRTVNKSCRSKSTKQP